MKMPRSFSRRSRDIGDDQVHPQHLLLGEHEAGVDDDEVAGELQHHHVLADLPQSTQGDDA
jgi:hypothetical protein